VIAINKYGRQTLLMQIIIFDDCNDDDDYDYDYDYDNNNNNNNNNNIS